MAGLWYGGATHHLPDDKVVETTERILEILRGERPPDIINAIDDDGSGISAFISPGVPVAILHAPRGT